MRGLGLRVVRVRDSHTGEGEGYTGEAGWDSEGGEAAVREAAPADGQGRDCVVAAGEGRRRKG